MKTLKSMVPLILALSLIIGCATLTPSQKVLWGLNVYQAQYSLYIERVMAPDLTPSLKETLRKDPSLITGNYINPNLTEDQKKILRVKKDILVQLKPLVLMAAEYNKTGMLPSEDIQNKLTELINKLVEVSEN